MSLVYRLCVLIFVLSLPSCATLTQEQCTAGAWERIGAADGAAGRALSYVDNHREACAPLGITPDVQRWAQGRQQGLRQYCTPDTAYALGRRGDGINPVCTTAERRAMVRGHQAGLRYFTLTRQIASLDHRRHDLIDKLHRISASDETDKRKRQIRALRQRIWTLEFRIQQLKLRRLASDL